jgi:hypothetical protein
MLVLLVIQNDRECTPQPFLLKPIRDRGLVSNLQLFHRTPPFPHCAGIEQERRNLTTSVYFAATSSPAYEPPGQSFYRLRLPHRRDLSAAQAKVWLGAVRVKNTKPNGRIYTWGCTLWCSLNRRPLHGGRRSTRSGSRYFYTLSRKILWSYRSLLRLRNLSVYLVDVLQRIDTHPAFDVHLLTPRLWKLHFAPNPLRSALDRLRP